MWSFRWSLLTDPVAWLLGVVLVLPIAGLYFRRRHKLTRIRGLCLSCGYPVVQGETTCPECGNVPRIRNNRFHKTAYRNLQQNIARTVGIATLVVMPLLFANTLTQSGVRRAIGSGAPRLGAIAEPMFAIPIALLIIQAYLFVLILALPRERSITQTAIYALALYASAVFAVKAAIIVLTYLWLIER